MILVTGATGDVGKEVVSELLRERGESVVAFDVALNPRRLPDSSKIVPVKGNILNLSELVSAMEKNGAKTVIHLASLLTFDCDTRPYEAVGVNLYGSATVLEACRICDVERIVFASTSSVYGETGAGAVIDEAYPKEPHNVYASLKYAAELYARAFSRKYGLSYAACRLRIIFGPGQRPDTGAMTILKVRKLIGELRESGHASFVGEPGMRLDVTHMKDAAHGLVLAASAKDLRYDAYNIMTGSYTFQEIARAFERAMPGSRISFGQPQSGGAKRRTFGTYDISRARSGLGYEPAYDIDKIVREVVEEELRGRSGPLPTLPSTTAVP